MESYQIDLPLLAEAAVEARRLGHPFIAPEHLFLALSANAEGETRTFLDRHGMTADAIRHSIATYHGTARSARPQIGTPTLAIRSILALGSAVAAGWANPEQLATYTQDELLKVLLSDDIASGAVLEAVLDTFSLSPAAARAELATGG